MADHFELLLWLKLIADSPFYGSRGNDCFLLSCVAEAFALSSLPLFLLLSVFLVAREPSKPAPNAPNIPLEDDCGIGVVGYNGRFGTAI